MGLLLEEKSKGWRRYVGAKDRSQRGNIGRHGKPGQELSRMMTACTWGAHEEKARKRTHALLRGMFLTLGLEAE